VIVSIDKPHSRIKEDLWQLPMADCAQRNKVEAIAVPVHRAFPHTMDLRQAKAVIGEKIDVRVDNDHSHCTSKHAALSGR
jgi:hypothetical protein